MEAWKFDDDNDIVLRHQYEDREELENDFFGSYDDEAEKRMDIIGQNGNDGLHYRATQEDEDEFDDYGKRIEHPTFEWGDEPEEDEEDLFDGDEWEANENLKSANERYKKEVKKKITKSKRNSK